MEEEELCRDGYARPACQADASACGESSISEGISQVVGGFADAQTDTYCIPYSEKVSKHASKQADELAAD